MAHIEDARRIALSFPSVVAREFQFRVEGKLFAWPYMERVAERKGRVERLDVLAVRVADEGEKKALLATDAAKFFTTAHYDGYPAVLVRLHAVDIEELTELITDAWRSRAPRRTVADFDAGSTVREKQPEDIG
jgi:hypothetical protein